MLRLLLDVGVPAALGTSLTATVTYTVALPAVVAVFAIAVVALVAKE